MSKPIETVRIEEARLAERVEQERAEAEGRKWLGALGALRDEARLTRDTMAGWAINQVKDGQMSAQVNHLLAMVERVLEMGEGRGL